MDKKFKLYFVLLYLLSIAYDVPAQTLNNTPNSGFSSQSQQENYLQKDQRPINYYYDNQNTEYNRRPFIPVRYSPVEVHGQPIFGSPIQHSTLAGDVQRLRRHDTNDYNDDDGRLISQSTFNRISETLDALNTVGRFIVNMTRGGQQDTATNNDDPNIISSTTESVPDAILTLTKNVLGPNVEKTIEPLVKGISVTETGASEKTKKKVSTINHQPAIMKKQDKFDKVDKIDKIEKIVETPPSRSEDEEIQEKDGQNRCRTPEGKPGRCDDLSNCPSLLLDLTHLRESLCFKSLFVPGVCCPIEFATVLTTARPLKLTTRPTHRPVTQTTPSQSLILKPAHPTTTKRPLVPVFTKPGSVPNVDNNGIDNSDNDVGSIIDPDECGQQEYSSGRIVGGIEAPNGQWPWMAAIFLHGPKRTEFWCGGSLIGTKYVLTAAHCTRDSKQRPFAARQFTVRLGDIDLSTDKEPSAPVTFRVTEVRAHPQFSRVGFYNDIAILVLDKQVRKSKYVIPVCLPNPLLTSKDRLLGRRATVVGWGTTYYGGKESTSQRQAQLPVWRNEDCNRAYFQPITDNFLCAGYSEGGVDACQGDSGGPLMMQVEARWMQLGIVSFGNKCGEPGYPGVYTRVTEYLDWISQNTQN